MAGNVATEADGWLRSDAMAGGGSSDLLLAQVRMACGRIAGGAAAIVEAHGFGVPEGPHGRPWTSAYHREAVHIYAESLSRSYQHDIAELFGSSADTMTEQSIPARLAEDWLIVTEYLRVASATITEWLVTKGGATQHPEPVRTPPIKGPTPMVIRFDALARLTTSEGASRLERAALAVQQHVEVPAPEVLDSRERHLLTRVAAGATIAELAAELAYSERSMYRALAQLWNKLGVPGRDEGLRKAAAEGLLD